MPPVLSADAGELAAACRSRSARAGEPSEQLGHHAPRLIDHVQFEIDDRVCKNPRSARGGLEQAEFAWGDELNPGGQHMTNTWQGSFPIHNLLDKTLLHPCQPAQR
ncbi:hypothetical protein J2W42_003012 [Rhizobium tibeticum]|nr:hypothetical protein [Rhizobium tibeticum]